MNSQLTTLAVRLAQHALGATRALAAGLAAVGACLPAADASIYGTMSNFDTYNTTDEPSEGAEIELEGCHASSVYNTFPAHYDHMTIAEYVNGAVFGTRITFHGYNFNLPVTGGSLAPNPNPTSTNGHALVNTDGGEHFGFAVTEQPTATRFFWLNRTTAGEYQRIGSNPVAIPNPTWNYVPANGGGRPQVEAEVRVPEPAEFHALKADSIWMKVYKSELPRHVELDELMSGNEPGNIVPQDEAEVESEWELLEGGVMKMHGDELDDDDSKAVVRRYEFFQYLGDYDEENEPLSAFLEGDMEEPPADELGPFIAANMVAANLVAIGTPGDFTGDGLADGSDFLEWQRQAGSADGGSADANFDGVVDETDLAEWSAAPPPAAAGALVLVPEPATFALAAAALALAAGHGRPRSVRGA